MMYTACKDQLLILSLFEFASLCNLHQVSDYRGESQACAGIDCLARDYPPQDTIYRIHEHGIDLNDVALQSHCG